MKSLIRLAFLALMLAGATTVFAVTTVNIPSGGNIATAVNGAAQGASGDCVTSWLTVHNAGICAIVANGNYVGPITITKTGTATQRIVIISATQYGAKITNPGLDMNGNFEDVIGFEMTAPTALYIQQQGPGASFNTFQYNYVHDVLTSSCHPNGVLNDIGSNAAPASHNTYNGNIIRHWGTTNTTACPPPQVSFHGIYSDGAAPTITNNIFSGGSGGWAIQKQYTTGASGATCAPGVIANNTVFNNQGGIVINERDGSGAPVSCSFAGWSVINNIIVNNGVAGTSAGTPNYGIDFFRYNAGNNALFSNNMIYGNLPANIFNNTGNTPATLQNPKTDASTSVTFANFRADVNSAPVSNYNVNDYALKAGSAAIQGGETGCASGGITPCAPTTDFARATRGNPPSVGAFDVGGPPPVSVLTLSPTSLNFLSVKVGATSTLPATLSNNNAGAVTVSTAILTGAGLSVSPSNPCVGSIVSSGSCNFNVTCAPTVPGPITGALTFTHNASNSPSILTLSCTGTQPSGHIVVPTPPTGLNFGSQQVNTSSGPQQVTFQNNGTAALTFSLIGTGGDFSIAPGSNDCPVAPATLAVSGTCHVSVVFTPTVVGTRNGTLSFASDDPLSPQTVGLTGIGQQGVIPPTGIVFQQGVIGAH